MICINETQCMVGRSLIYFPLCLHLQGVVFPLWPPKLVAIEAPLAEVYPSSSRSGRFGLNPHIIQSLRFTICAFLDLCFSQSVLFSISAFLNQCFSQSVRFSICAILNQCFSQLVFFSICAILNQCFSQSVRFSICAILNQCFSQSVRFSISVFLNQCYSQLVRFGVATANQMIVQLGN